MPGFFCVHNFYFFATDFFTLFFTAPRDAVFAGCFTVFFAAALAGDFFTADVAAPGASLAAGLVSFNSFLKIFIPSARFFIMPGILLCPNKIKTNTTITSISAQPNLPNISSPVTISPHSSQHHRISHSDRIRLHPPTSQTRYAVCMSWCRSATARPK